MQIWKYNIELTGQQTVDMPIGARILDVQMQCDDCCIWMLCETAAVVEPRCFNIYRTGHDILSDPGIYIATFQKNSLVFHIFESVHKTVVSSIGDDCKDISQTNNSWRV